MSNLLSSHPSPDTTLPVLSYCNHTVNSITQINMIYVSIVTDFKDSTLNSSVLLYIILLRLVRQIAFQAITSTQHEYCLGPNDSMPQWTDQNKGKQKPPFNLPEWQPEWQPPEQTNRRRQRAVKYAKGQLSMQVGVARPCGCCSNKIPRRMNGFKVFKDFVWKKIALR